MNKAVLYCLAYAARETGLAVHAFTCLSNHYHVVVTDPEDDIPRFAHRLNSLLARCLNAMRARFGYFFDGSKPSYVRAIEPVDVVHQLVYTYCNPVSSGLVPEAKEWPGVRSEPSQFGTTIYAEKPGWFFSDEMPEELPLEITPPPCFAERDREELAGELEQKVAEREAATARSVSRCSQGRFRPPRRTAKPARSGLARAKIGRLGGERLPWVRRFRIENLASPVNFY